MPRIHRLKSRIALGLGALALLAACETASTPPTTGVLAPITPAQANDRFRAVCGASLPDFANARALMSQIGVTAEAASGTVFSTTENLSFKIIDGPGRRKTCSMVYATTADDQTIGQTALRLAPFRTTARGNTATYPGTNTRVEFNPQAVTNGDVTFINLRLLSER
jgi:hypothetical protein